MSHRTAAQQRAASMLFGPTVPGHDRPAHMLPTFLVVGAMKAGTTTIHAHLRNHPDVFVPERKELDFFSHETVWERGVAWYQEQFAGAGAFTVAGECSPSYAILDA